MARWTAGGTAAVVLAGCLGLGWAAAFTAAAWGSTPLSREGLTALAGIGQTLAGALGAYVGMHLGIDRAGREDDA